MTKFLITVLLVLNFICWYFDSTG